MDIKEIIDYCEIQSSDNKTTNFRKLGSGTFGKEYVIQFLPPDGKEIEEWLLERIKAFTKLNYLYELSAGAVKPMFEQKVKHLCKATSLKNFRIVVDAKGGAYLQYNGLYFELEEFEDYKELISNRLSVMRKSIEDNIDSVMKALGELSQKQEDLEAKIKELGLEDDNND